jgi:hypothetical protein
MVVYFNKNYIHFVFDTKPVDTCFGIFDLPIFAVYVLRQVSASQMGRHPRPVARNVQAVIGTNNRSVSALLDT